MIHRPCGAAPGSLARRLRASDGRILGAQAVGSKGVDKRIDTLATAITAGFTASRVVGLDLGYTPAVSTRWDPVQVAAQEAAALALGPGRP